MAQAIVNDVNYLAARLHGRRSRLAEGERLATLCRLTDFQSFSRAVYPDVEFDSATDFQRRAVHDLVRELSGFLKHVDDAGADLVKWLLVAFQVENVKVLIRTRQRTPLETPEEYLIFLPRDLALDVPSLLGAGSLEEFADRLPADVLRRSLKWALATYRDHPQRPFFLEAALDHGYLQELLNRTEHLPTEDKELVQPIMVQEVDAFHLMLAVRGRFHYDLSPQLLSPLHLRRSRISRARFGAMLKSPDIRSAATLAAGLVFDALPPATIDGPLLEALAWRRYLRLSNCAFRRSHMGLAAVIGFVGIRRGELANLITLSETVSRAGATDAIRSRFAQHNDLESVYV